MTIRATTSLSSVALTALLATRAFAGDLVVELDAGTGFVIQNDGATVERLRVEEASGNVSRNGALFVHTTGGTFVGPGAGNLGSTGSGNTAFGNLALSGVTSGTDNSAFGADALALSSYSSSNSAFGSEALFYNYSGSENAAFGSRALFYSSYGSRQSAFGAGALYGILGSAGTRNSAFGAGALGANEFGAENAAFGAGALDSNSYGSANSAFGYQALGGDTGSSSAFGWKALGSNIAGGGNTAVGARALYSNTDGDYNTALGLRAGENQTTGSRNIYLDNVGVAGESGRIKIGNTNHTATYIEGIDGVTLGTGNAVYIDASNRLGAAVSSSRRTKQDVVDMGDASGVLANLRPVLFRYRPEVVGESEAKVVHYGLIAEEVAAVAPQLVTWDDAGEPRSVQYRLLTPLLLNELQRQRRMAEQHHARLTARLEALESRLRDHEAGADR